MAELADQLSVPPASDAAAPALVHPGLCPPAITAMMDLFRAPATCAWSEHVQARLLIQCLNQFCYGCWEARTWPIHNSRRKPGNNHVTYYLTLTSRYSLER